jgi:hypothetical protein
MPQFTTIEKSLGEATVVMTTEQKIDSIHVPLDRKLVGHPVRVTDAATKYDISHVNLSRWADAGYIRIIERAPKLLVLDEADVKRAVEIFTIAKEHTTPRRAGWILKKSIEEDT